MLLLSAAEDAFLQALVWYARVPTSANIADGPSREILDEMESKGAIRDAVSMIEKSELDPAYFVHRMNSLGKGGAAGKKWAEKGSATCLGSCVMQVLHGLAW